MNQTVESDSEVVIPNQSWADYEELVRQRGDRAGIRVRYCARTREIRLMTRLPEHGNNSSVLASLIEAILRHQNREWDGFAPITLQRVGKAGVEPAQSFYIDPSDAILGKRQFDLEKDPPPDLAIEVGTTSDSTFEEYAAVRIPELWVLSGGCFTIYLWDGQQYHPSTESRVFPHVPVVEVVPRFVARAWEVGSSVALREFNQWLREHVPQ